MSTMQQSKIRLLSADFHGQSTLPAIAFSLGASQKIPTQLDEDDELFVNYGSVDSVFPYRCQDLYDRAQTPTEYTAITLENEHLKAVFLPEFGGKLRELTDKHTGRNLLFSNDVIRPCNLAVRNAWLSGGVEWNCGFRGHHAFTCSLINTAQTQLDDGTPVLRFYYFERIRCAVVQMDFFLPDGSQFLYVRTRITNPNEDVIPMYWWSNIAVEQKEGDRVVVPACQSYTADAQERVSKIDIPIHNHTDVTYPNNTIIANDFFWKMDPKKRPYIAQLDKNGYGLCQSSTPRLRGRKLFVWGNSQGGKKWASFLTGEGQSGSYAEIQAGLASSQYECLPMPPKTVWEWVECYGAMQADPAKIHGAWTDAQQEAETILDARIPASTLEALLEKTRPMAKSPAQLLIPMNDGWAALELARRAPLGQDLMNSHLDFGPVTPESACWLQLLNEGTVGIPDETAVPQAYMRQSQWLALLEQAIAGRDKDNWYACYLLGTAYIAEEKLPQAKAVLERSAALKDTIWAAYALAVVNEKLKAPEAACSYMKKACQMRPADVALAKDACRCLLENGDPQGVIQLVVNGPACVQENARCQLYRAYALLRLGQTEEAERILCGADGNTYLVVPDVREGENSVTELWFQIQRAKGAAYSEPPADLDFRMDARRSEWV